MSANPRRVAACLAACAGIPLRQLEAMNAIEHGSLASAYDAASAIVEGIGFAVLEDDDAMADVPGDDLYDAVSDARPHALRACAWTREARK